MDTTKAILTNPLAKIWTLSGSRFVTASNSANKPITIPVAWAKRFTNGIYALMVPQVPINQLVYKVVHSTAA